MRSGRMPPFAVVAAAWLLAAACATPERDAALPPVVPAEVVEPQPFSFPDGSATASVPARLVDAKESPGELATTFDLGDANRASCYFGLGGEALAKPAHLLMTTLAVMIRARAPDAMPELTRRVRAGAVGIAPFLATDTWMRHEGQASLFAQRLAIKDERVVLCAQFSAGPTERFDRFFFGLVETLESRPAPPAPQFGVVETMHLDGEPIGVSSTALRALAGGDFALERRAMLLLGAPDAFASPVDSFEFEHAARDGTLRSSRARRTSAYRDELDLEARSAGGGSWRVHGQLAGRPVDEGFRAAKPPTSFLQHVRAVADAARRGQLNRPIREQHWLPQLAVGGLSEVVVTLERTDTGAIQAYERVGANVLSYALDAEGRPDSGTTELAGHLMEQRRQMLFGTLPGMPDAAKR